MPRPCACKWVSCKPCVCYFKPAGVPMRCLEEVLLGIDECEALKLVDYLGLGQEAAAEKMHVSQPTLSRILAGARKKTAEAVTQGKALRIEGGKFEVRV